MEYSTDEVRAMPPMPVAAMRRVPRRRPPPPARLDAEAAGITKKRCTVCEQELDFDYFPYDAGERTGLYGLSRECAVCSARRRGESLPPEWKAGRAKGLFDCLDDG